MGHQKERAAKMMRMDCEEGKRKKGWFSEIVTGAEMGLGGQCRIEWYMYKGREASGHSGRFL